MPQKSMIDKLLEHGFRLKHHRPGNQKILCPRCSHTRSGAGQKDPCISLTINETADFAFWNCHHCHWSDGCGSATGQRPPAGVNKTQKEYKKPVSDAEKYSKTFPPAAYEYLTVKRKISPEVIKSSGIFFEPKAQAICFPFYDSPARGVLNIKHRAMNEKKFWLEAQAKITFYGLEDITPETKKIIIVEGEFDRLALKTCGFEAVLSVPHGAPAQEVDPKTAGTKWDFIIFAEEMLKSMREVVIAVDNDEKGKFLENELIRRIGKEKCSIVTFPDGLKDANDVLIELGIDALCDCINEAKPMPVKGLFTVEQFQSTAVDFFNNGMKRGTPTGWSNADAMYSVMTGQVTVVTGVPNSGKSEFLDALTINLAKYNDWKFMVFSPENGKEQHVVKLVEKIIGQPTDPKSLERMSETDFGRGLAWLSSRYFFAVAEDQDELPTIDWILQKAKAAVMRYGVKGIIIDPYNEIEHALPKGMQETTYISQLLSKIKRFAKAFDVHVWIIAHPAKMQKDKDGNIMCPNLYDISGSANWVNKADCGIVVHRNATPNVTEVHFKKIRFKHVGRQGVCYLLYNRDTGTYTVPESEAQYTSVNNTGKKTKKSDLQEELYDSSDIIQF